MAPAPKWPLRDTPPRGPARWLVMAGVMAALAGPPAAQAAPKVVDPLLLPAETVTSRTVLTGDVTGGPERESVALVEYLTPERKGPGGVGLLLGVYAGEGTARRLLWTRDYAAVSDGFAAGGTLALLDLDGDDRPEIIVTWQRQRTDAIEETMEILRAEGEGFVPAWSGTTKRDTSRASDVGVEQRERYTREIDLAKTERTHGGLVFFRKTVMMAAGVVVDPPRELEESFPLGLNVRPALTGTASGRN